MPSGRTLAFVVAHPDDDAYGIAGVVALHADEPDFRLVLVHATYGENGDIREGFPATPDTLGAVRRQEDESAWRALGRVPDRHEWLGYPDGGLSQIPFDQLVDAVGALLDEEQPTVVGTLGPDGIFGHPDHIAIGAATDAAFAQRASTTGHSFRRLLHGVIPNSVFERWQAQRAAMGRELFDPTQMYHMRGVPDEDIAIVMDCRGVSDRIVAGLLEHRSQHHVFFDDPTETDRWRRVVSRLWFDVAWPRQPPGAPVLADVFEGLS